MLVLDEVAPIYSIFILVLIIASNYIGELFPCRIQSLLGSNVFLKHIISFLTLLFFVVLTDPNKSNTFTKIFTDSVKLYFIFLLLINTNLNFFISSLLIAGIIYMTVLIKNDYTNKLKDDENNEDLKNNIEYINKINNVLFIIFMILLVVGFVIYMGEKKIEYKKDFNYITFIFGKPSCKGQSPDTKYLNALKYAFK